MNLIVFLERKLAVNLRQNKSNDKQILISLWEKRLSLCNDRKNNELDVEKHNKQLAKLIKELLQPIAKKTKLPIFLDVQEDSTKLTIPLIYDNRTAETKFSITMSYSHLYELLLNESNLNYTLNKIESKLRLFSKLRSTLKPKSEKTSLRIDNSNLCGDVIVSFSTRTKYF